jgi:hypothetical protein
MEPEHAAFPESKLPSIQIQIRVVRAPSQSPVTSLNGGGGKLVVFATTRTSSSAEKEAPETPKVGDCTSLDGTFSWRRF